DCTRTSTAGSLTIDVGMSTGRASPSARGATLTTSYPSSPGRENRKATIGSSARKIWWLLSAVGSGGLPSGLTGKHVSVAGAPGHWASAPRRPRTSIGDEIDGGGSGLVW